MGLTHFLGQCGGIQGKFVKGNEGRRDWIPGNLGFLLKVKMFFQMLKLDCPINFPPLLQKYGIHDLGARSPTPQRQRVFHVDGCINSTQGAAGFAGHSFMQSQGLLHLAALKRIIVNDCMKYTSQPSYLENILQIAHLGGSFGFCANQNLRFRG